MVRNLSEANIPEDWKYDNLDKFAKRGSGHTPNKEHPQYWNGGVKWISLSDSSALDKGYVFKTDKEVSEEGIKNSSAVLHPAETVVLSRDAGVGKSALMAEPMAVSQHFIVWRCDNKKTLNSWFLYNWLQIMKPEFERQAVGSTIKTIGLSYFKKLKIAVPPYAEQKKIAQILSTWDKAITATEQLLANSQQQKKALMQQLLTGKKRFSGFSGDWEKVELEKLYFFKKGKGLSKSAISESGKKKCVLYGELYTKYGEVITDVFSRTDVDDGLASLAGDILIPSSTTTSGIDLANVTAVLEDGVFLGGDINVLRPKKILDAIFMAHLLTHIKKHDIASRAQGITIIHLYGSDLKDLRVFVPRQTLEQQKVSSVLSAADREIVALQQKLNYFKQEKKALMQQLLTGKRRVKIEE
jgi:type I restriction enzyme S subunit